MKNALKKWLPIVIAITGWVLAGLQYLSAHIDQIPF